MGVTFVAILSHHFDNSNILSVPDLLNADENLRNAVAFDINESAARASCIWQWDYYYVDKPTETNVELLILASDLVLRSAAFSVLLGRAMCRFSSWHRWYSFVENLKVQNGLRRVCHAIAEICGGGKAIYIPDSSWLVSIAWDKTNEGFTFEQVQDWLLKTYGPPVDSLKNTQALRPFDNIVGGYYIDDFKDLD